MPELLIATLHNWHKHFAFVVTAKRNYIIAAKCQKAQVRKFWVFFKADGSCWLSAAGWSLLQSLLCRCCCNAELNWHCPFFSNQKWQFLFSTVCCRFGLFYCLCYSFHTSTSRKQWASFAVTYQVLATPEAESRGSAVKTIFLFQTVSFKHSCRYVGRPQVRHVAIFLLGVIQGTCWPNLNAYQRCYLKAHYVIVFNLQHSFWPWRIWFHLTAPTVPFFKVMHGHVWEQQ